MQSFSVDATQLPVKPVHNLSTAVQPQHCLFHRVRVGFANSPRIAVLPGPAQYLFLAEREARQATHPAVWYAPCLCKSLDSPALAGFLCLPHLHLQDVCQQLLPAQPPADPPIQRDARH